MKEKSAPLKMHPFIIRFLHWEYWPFGMVYLPIYFVYLWLGIRARSFFFFAAANPTIKNGGFLMETKMDIAPLLPPSYTPLTLYFEPGTTLNSINITLEKHQISYPIIVKPNMGARGRGVKKINNAAELAAVLPAYTVPFIIQPFVEFPNEIGLFYVKMPGEKNGKITGIVRKEFLSVTGDGSSSILDLLRQNKRYILQIPILHKIAGDKLHLILPKGQQEIIVPYGNHARGCLFVDDSHLITKELEFTMNNVCNQVDGFYYGRLDIRYNTWEELKAGKNFSIIELNGAGSEPTHIYDPQHSIFFAWKEIIRHLVLLYQIAKKNHELGHPYLSFKEGIQMFKDNSAYDKTLNALIV